MQLYESYKPSGILWLGDIPSHWEVMPLRALTQLKSDRNQPNLPVLSVYREYGVILKSSRDDNHNATSQDTSNYKVVKPGDLVVNKMKAWQGSMGVSSHYGIVSPAYITCSTKNEKVQPNFLHYLLRSSPLIGIYNALSYGVRVGQWDMHFEDFKQILIPLPPRIEQDCIVAYLDKKTAEIDATIAKKERLIGLLQEQKSILIKRTVTLGLNPDAPIKNSGIKWVGNIPRHWVVSPGFICFKENKDRNKALAEKTLLSLSHGQIVIKPEEKMTGLMPDSFESYQLVRNGDIVIRTTDLQNDQTSLRVGLVKDSGMITSAYLGLRCNTEINPNYVFRLLESYDALKVFYGMGSGLRQNLGFKDFKRMSIPLPPRKEQDEIAEFLEKTTNIARIASAKLREEIKKMRELKSLIVASVVTGKIAI